jgi:hypothetical protein
VIAGDAFSRGLEDCSYAIHAVEQASWVCRAGLLTGHELKPGLVLNARN